VGSRVLAGAGCGSDAEGANHPVGCLWHDPLAGDHRASHWMAAAPTACLGSTVDARPGASVADSDRYRQQGRVFRVGDRSQSARQGGDRSAIPRRAAWLLFGAFSADLLARLVVRSICGALRVGAAPLAGGALLRMLDRSNLDRF